MIQQIIDVYTDQHDPTVAGLAAQAYGMRGDLEQLLRQDYYAAIEDYDSALAIDGIYPEHRMFYTRFKGDCYYWLGQFTNAANQYEVARQQAMSLRLSAHADLYEALRDMMDEEMQQTREP